MLLSKMASNMAANTQKYVYIRSEVSYNNKWSVEYNIFKVRESIYRSGNSVRMLLSKMASNMAANTQKYVYIRSEVSYNNKWSVEYNIFKVKESIYRSGNSVRMLLSKMASNMAANTQKYVYIRSEVSYNNKWSVEYNIFKVKESIYRSGNSVRMLLSKMASNMAANTQKYVYIRSEVSYNNKWSVEYNIFKVKESIYRSGNSVRMLLSKMASNMAAKTQKYVYIRSEVSYNNKWSVEYNIFKVKKSIYRSGNSVRMLLSKMASNMAAKTQKYVYIRSEVSYNNKWSVEYNIFKVKESIYRKRILVEDLEGGGIHPPGASGILGITFERCEISSHILPQNVCKWTPYSYLKVKRSNFYNTEKVWDEKNLGGGGNHPPPLVARGLMRWINLTWESN